MKKIAKKKYSYIVNLDNIEVLDDIAPVFALAKHKAGLALTDDELADICVYMIDAFGPRVCVVNCACGKKKLPWYKRFWRWLTRK